MAVLYRKHRPQTFSEVIGQKYIVQTLQNQVKSGGLSHAYLFTGTRGVGKTSVARILAKAVNCELANKQISSSVNKLEGDACGECSICKAIENNNFIDLVEIDAASNTGVDNIRELIDHVKFSPSVGKYKIFIIDEVHMLSKGAFNALLKTLEEPPKHAIFILATTETGKVPATIISRVQRFDFKNLPFLELEEHLTKVVKEEKLELDKKVISLVAKNAEGSVRDSLSLLEKILSLGENPPLEECMQLLGVTETTLSSRFFEILAKKEVEKIPEYVDLVFQKAFDLQIFVRDFLEYLRKALIFKAGNSEIEPNLEVQDLEEFKQLVALVNISEIMLFIRLFLKAYKDMEYAPSQNIPLLVAGIECATRAGASPLKPEIDKKKIVSEPKPQPIVTSTSSELKTEVLEPEVLATSGKEVSFAEIQLAWPAIVVRAKEVHLPLSNLLKSCSLEEFADNRLVLGVKFLFNKQSLETSKNQSMLKSLFLEILGTSITFSVLLLKHEPKNLASPESIDNALKVFGGEIIQ